LETATDATTSIASAAQCAAIIGRCRHHAMPHASANGIRKRLSPSHDSSA